MKKLISLASLLTVALFAVSSAHAQMVIQLTGGDQGEGFAPLANVAVAFAVGTSVDSYTPVSVQGVTFATDPGVTKVSGTVGGTTYSDSSNPLVTGDTTLSTGFSNSPDHGTSTNDTNLLSVLGALEYAGSVSSSDYYTGGSDSTQAHGQYTIKGLTLGVTYQVDLFETNYPASGGTTSRETVYEVIGGSASPLTGNVLALDTPQIVEFDLTPDSSGDITINYGSDNGNALGLLSAVAVTYAPEPPTWALLLGGVALMAVCRRSKLKNLFA